MKKLIVLPNILTAILLSACSESKNTPKGEFLLGNLYADLIESGETYYMVLPIEWTGDEPADITSVELVKEDGDPVTFEKDGIAYEFHGADPLKQTGLYSGEHDIGRIENIGEFQVQGEGRIVAKVLLGEVKEDESRQAKITFRTDDREYGEVVEWDTFKQLSTILDS
ncbi:hypothetical protein KZX50_16510 [Bacillus infantis]|uniref:hypothetical protein n=1 Tax=Bacillus infantis TaxID=324767 RepID=UPI000B9B925E|nr:hypothetical protein [Bacillus infantis]MCK6207047.1 hypothetical protein [Bacillus infantis]OXT15074.1 hypothetical protein B9K06_22980 [Bacillus sp. OG2]